MTPPLSDTAAALPPHQIARTSSQRVIAAAAFSSQTGCGGTFLCNSPGFVPGAFSEGMG